MQLAERPWTLYRVRRFTEVIIDEEDAQRVLLPSWCVVMRNKRYRGEYRRYPYIFLRCVTRWKEYHISFGQYLLDLPTGSRVDFINRNRLDFRKNNLRVNSLPLKLEAFDWKSYILERQSGDLPRLDSRYGTNQGDIRTG